MGDTDDDITLLFLLQYLCHFLCLGDRIEIFDTAIVGFGYQTGKFRTQSENTNLQSLALDNGVRLYDICQFGTSEIIVGADNSYTCTLFYYIIMSKLLEVLVQTMSREDIVTDIFDGKLWLLLVEKATMGTDGKLTFTLRNGMEVEM